MSNCPLYRDLFSKLSSLNLPNPLVFGLAISCLGSWHQAVSMNQLASGFSHQVWTENGETIRRNPQNHSRTVIWIYQQRIFLVEPDSVLEKIIPGLVTMLMVSPPRPEVVGPLPNGRTPWLINGGDPNYLLSGGWSSKYGTLLADMIWMLQPSDHSKPRKTMLKIQRFGLSWFVLPMFFFLWLGGNFKYRAEVKTTCFFCINRKEFRTCASGPKAPTFSEPLVLGTPTAYQPVIRHVY